jgi:hypothetical protein
MNIFLEIARSIFIFSEPPKRKETWLYLQNIDDAFSIDERWANLSDNERNIWVEKAKVFMNDMKTYFPDVYDDIMNNVSNVNDKPLWWKTDIF